MDFEDQVGTQIMIKEQSEATYLQAPFQLPINFLLTWPLFQIKAQLQLNPQAWAERCAARNYICIIYIWIHIV